MNTLKITLIFLPIIEIAIFIWLLVRKDTKQKKDNPVLFDDGPGQYDDVELCEKPYVHLN